MTLPPAPPPRSARAPALERDVLDALRRDGTLDTLRARALDDLAKDEHVKTFAEFVVRSSSVLRDARARGKPRGELVDALFRECEGAVLDEARKAAWGALTDAREGVGREAFERSFVAAQEARGAERGS